MGILKVDGLLICHFGRVSDLFLGAAFLRSATGTRAGQHRRITVLIIHAGEAIIRHKPTPDHCDTRQFRFARGPLTDTRHPPAVSHYCDH